VAVQDVQEHAGYAELLTQLTGSLSGSSKVSTEVLGAVLQELAIAAPEGRLRSELVARIGPGDGTTYSHSTVAKALAVLEQGGLLTRRASYARPGGGRPPERYTLGSQRWAMLGVHVSLDGPFTVQLTASLHGLSGELIHKTSQGLQDRAIGWDGVAKEIAVLANDVVRTWKDGASERSVLGLGIEVPGHVYRGWVLQADHAGVQSQPHEEGRVPSAALVQLVGQHLEDALTVVLDNDVNLIALREVYRRGARSRRRDGAVVAVFDQGIGAGLVENGIIYRGHHGAAGESGHEPVFTAPGLPRPVPSKASQPPVAPGSRLGFADPCSCGSSGHVDCYAVPDRLCGQLNASTRDFERLAVAPAYDDAGRLTQEGKAFWEGGEALGLGLVSLLHSVNPGWLLLLLRQDLAAASPGDSTAAGLYRQAIEVVVDEHAFSTTARDARAGGHAFEVKALASDDTKGAEKAARNAALRVIDEFTMHALKRDDCFRAVDAPPLAVTTPGNPREDLRARDRAARKDLRAIMRHYDPEGLLEAGAPADEYSGEEAELLRLIVRGKLDREAVCDIWRERFGPTASLLANEPLTAEVTRELLALQSRWTA